MTNKEFNDYRKYIVDELDRIIPDLDKYGGVSFSDVFALFGKFMDDVVQFKESLEYAIEEGV